MDPESRTAPKPRALAGPQTIDGRNGMVWRNRGLPATSEQIAGQERRRNQNGQAKRTFHGWIPR